jgi:glycosyltransferase involved in cell wall biosynthesis
MDFCGRLQVQNLFSNTLAAQNTQVKDISQQSPIRGEFYETQCPQGLRILALEGAGDDTLASKLRRMRIVQITPGAGGMYCGNCFRDNALVAEWRRQGHEVLMIPLYLPMTLDEENQSSGIPVFFSGINVYLEQKLPLLGKMPDFLHKQLASPALLKWASRRAAKTRASELGELTLSMINGEEGRQAREIDELLAYLRRHERPEIIVLSNALLVGMARKIKRELNVPVVCTLQGEDSFLDNLPASHREKTWLALSDRCRDVDLFIAPSAYFGELMGRRLKIPAEKITVVHNGLKLDGWSVGTPPNPPVLGFFARMCKEKGLDLLIDTFILLKKRARVPNLKLHVGGAMGPGDEPFVNELKLRLQGSGVLGDVTFFSNLTKEQKQQFFRRISVMSVPALYGEAFGLYLLEAWAAGVPVVQPPVAAFPELIEASGGGVVTKSATPEALAEGIEQVLLDETKRQFLSKSARHAMEEQFTAEAMARRMTEAFTRALPAAAAEIPVQA